jgi:hypothetical protein
MLRHSVLWVMREPFSEDARLAMLRRLAYLGTECPMVTSGDYGADLFGGSENLLKIPPYTRLPRWRRASETEGPVYNHDMALHLDFVDWDAFEEYNVDPDHDQASAENVAANYDELTARCDYYYEGDTVPTHAGEVKHVAMFVWDDHAPEADREKAIEAVEALADAEGVKSVLTGINVGKLTTDYDWILDLRLADREAAEKLLNGDAYGQAMEAVAPATRYEWTARMSHVMHRP